MQIPIQILNDAYMEGRKAYLEERPIHFITFTQEADGRITYSFSQ